MDEEVVVNITILMAGIMVEAVLTIIAPTAWPVVEDCPLNNEHKIDITKV